MGFITWIWVGLIHREVRNMLEDLVSGVQLRGVTRRRCGIIRLAHNVNRLAGRNASIFGGYKQGKIQDIPFVFLVHSDCSDYRPLEIAWNCLEIERIHFERSHKSQNGSLERCFVRIPGCFVRFPSLPLAPAVHKLRSMPISSLHDQNIWIEVYDQDSQRVEGCLIKLFPAAKVQRGWGNSLCCFAAACSRHQSLVRFKVLKHLEH